MNAEPTRNLTFTAIEAEQALLGAMLANNDAIAGVMGTIEAKHFYEAAHSRIFEAIIERVKEGKQVSVVALAAEFRDDPALKEIGGGAAYLARLFSSAPTIINAPAYAEAVVDAWVRRTSINAIDDMRAQLDTGTGKALATLKQTLGEIAASAQTEAARTRKSAAMASLEVVDRVNRALMHGEDPVRGVRCGMIALDDVIGRWQRGMLYLIAARPSMGKTTVATSWMKQAAKAGANCLYFSMEMGADQIIMRLLSDLVFHPDDPAIHYEDIAKARLNAEQMQRVMDAHYRLGELPIVIDDRRRLTVEQIHAAALLERQRLATLGKTLDLVFIDHAGLIKTPNRYNGNKVAELQELSNELKRLPYELDCAMVALLQLNREVEKRDNKRPMLADLRGSGTWEEDADVVLMPYREAYYLERAKLDDPLAESDRKTKLAEMANRLEVLVTKNRLGKLRDMTFFANMAASAIRDEV